MIAWLSRHFGMEHLELAEDVVQDTLCQALLVWPVQGIPDNPSAWLMRVARNRAIDLVRRNHRLRDFTPELSHQLSQREEPPAGEEARDIEDDQLRMMFACCHPGLSSDVQVTLILKTLCGLSVGEIAQALFATADSIEKRLGRARRYFRESVSPADLTAPAEISPRIDAICQAIYLLFNEGYHGSQSETSVREDLCYDALRLSLLLSGHRLTASPRASALSALLCFQAARLTSRADDDGHLVQLALQDRSRWDPALIAKGFEFLAGAAAGDQLTEYHLEAMIASLHCAAPTIETTDWTGILELYHLLYRLKPTPIVGLNRAVATGNAHGPEAGLQALTELAESTRLEKYPFYPAAEGEFLMRQGKTEAAAGAFARAAQLARTRSETDFFQRKLDHCRRLSASDPPHTATRAVYGPSAR